MQHINEQVTTVQFHSEFRNQALYIRERTWSQVCKSVKGTSLSTLEALSRLRTTGPGWPAAPLTVLWVEVERGGLFLGHG